MGVVNGTCSGAILSSTDAAFAMGLGDPAGRFCSLQYVGAPLSSDYFAIPWNLRTPQPEMTALDSIAVAAVSFGDYQAGAAAANFPTDRAAACLSYDQALAASAQADLLSPLSFTQLAGIFFVVLLARARAV